MTNKLDAFYAAQSQLWDTVNRQNDVIRYKFDVQLANGEQPDIPKFIPYPDVDEIIELAKKIESYIS